MDTTGAEKLLGRGDALFLDAAGGLKRIHGAYVADNDIREILEPFRGKVEELSLEEYQVPEKGKKSIRCRKRTRCFQTFAQLVEFVEGQGTQNPGIGDCLSVFQTDGSAENAGASNAAAMITNRKNPVKPGFLGIRIYLLSGSAATESVGVTVALTGDGVSPVNTGLGSSGGSGILISPAIGGMSCGMSFHMRHFSHMAHFFFSHSLHMMSFAFGLDLVKFGFLFRCELGFESFDVCLTDTIHFVADFFHFFHQLAHFHLILFAAFPYDFSLVAVQLQNGRPTVLPSFPESGGRGSASVRFRRRWLKRR